MTDARFSFQMIQSKRESRLPRRLLCFPYAGAGHSPYNFWSRDLLDGMDTAFVKLSNSSSSPNEPPLPSIQSLADRIAHSIVRSASQIAEHDLALYGHSMGALLAFETARALQVKHGLEVTALFVSGCAAPSTPRQVRLSGLSDEALLAAIASMDGMPAEIRQDPELVNVFLPAIRADIAVCEAYDYTPAPRLTCPVTVFAGTSDDYVPLPLLDGWAQETTNSSRTLVYPGGHFFIIEHQAAILRLLKASLGSPLELLDAIA